MIRTVAGIQLETRAMVPGDRGYVGVRLARRTGYPLHVVDLLLDHGRCAVWCSVAHPTTLHGYAVFAHAVLVDAFVMPALKRFGLDDAAVAEMTEGKAA